MNSIPAKCENDEVNCDDAMAHLKHVHNLQYRQSIQSSQLSIVAIYVRVDWDQYARNMKARKHKTGYIMTTDFAAYQTEVLGGVPSYREGGEDHKTSRQVQKSYDLSWCSLLPSVKTSW